MCTTHGQEQKDNSGYIKGVHMNFSLNKILFPFFLRMKGFK